jgi:hypothetical protein
MAISYSRTASFIDRQKAAMVVGYGTVTLDDAYPAGGWALTKAAVNKNISSIYHYDIEPVPGFDIKWDHANGKLKAVKNGYSNDDSVGFTITYIADASTPGTALLVANAAGGGYFESELAHNADVTPELVDDGPTVTVFDNEGTPTGVQVYCDEDGGDGAELLCVSPNGQDIMIPCSDGNNIIVKHDADAASNGVAVYIDDDATETYQYILCVLPGEADVVATRPTMPIDALDGVVLRMRYEAI